MLGFALQKQRLDDKEEKAILYHCILNKIPYKFCSSPGEVPTGYIPVGTVKWCENFLPKDRIIPDYYPDFMKDYLFRKVWWTETWPMEKGIFVKPADRHKKWTGFVTVGGYRKKKKGPYWCSEVVKFINEWRYYIADGKVIAGEWYWGDEVNMPDAPVFQAVIPAGFCGTVDMGTLGTGELALVEVHPPYACGWYGKDHRIYAEWIIKGWEYLTHV